MELQKQAEEKRDEAEANMISVRIHLVYLVHSLMCVLYLVTRADCS